MNSQVLLAVSQIHQQELRQAAREARLVSRSQPRARFALARRFRVTTGTRQPMPAVGAQPRTV